MTSSYASTAQNGSARSSYTVTALGRWSVIDKQLPAVDKIKYLHVYDFDNTLFKTPLPNAKLWNGTTIGTLANPNAFVNGGWWHDSRILAATGDGIVKEEPRAWEGWWNEKIVELVRLSMEQRDALCVLLTGRSEAGFGELVKRMVISKQLDFDMVSLKPAVGPNNERFESTMIFKQIFLTNLMETYKGAEEIRIYEDRPKHVKGFRDFMTDYNKKQNGVGGSPTRGPILAEVVQVADMATNLDPVVEVAEVQHLINAHNQAVSRRQRGVRGERLMIKKTVFYTGYFINPTDTQRLLTLAQIPPNMRDAELKFHANNIMICPRPCPKSILDKVGGMGAKMTWEVTGTACFENSIWAACLKPVPASSKFHTDNPSPLVVLALRKGARPVDAGKIQNWQPVPPDKAFVFETYVGEKVLLRIEPEDPSEGAYESLFANKTSKRKHTGDEEGNFRQTSNNFSGRGPGNRHEQRHFHQAAHMNRGGSNQGRGNSRGGNHNGASGRGFKGGRGGGPPRGPRGGRGGGHHYRSLDDVDSRANKNGFQQQVSYEDNPSTSQRQQPQPQQQQQMQQAPQMPQMPQMQQMQQNQYYNQPSAQYQPPQSQQYQQPFNPWPAQQQQQQQPERPMGGGPAGNYGNNGPDMQNYY